MNYKVGKRKNMKLNSLRRIAVLIISMVFLFSNLVQAHVYTGRVSQAVKSGSTYYTDEKIKAARENIQNYKWAQSIYNSTIKEADGYVNLGYDYMWNLVTDQAVPRSYAVNESMGCPVCGRKIDKFGQHPYLYDVINKPFKIECPNCHTVFPTNDYAAYYKSGLDAKGNFVKGLANKALLVNTLYPKKGAGFGVDDGSGFKDKNGKKYTFVAYYNHWALWNRGIITRAVNSLRDAYLYTGDMKYARSGIVLLDRIAQVYPSMNISVYKESDGFLNSSGGTGLGKVLGSIWETDLVKSFIKAYDAFFPVIGDNEARQYITGKMHLKITKTRDNIINDIEKGILLQVLPAVKSGQIKGNNGMYQSVVALAAVVLDRNPETKNWLDFDFAADAGGGNETKVTGGNILPVLINNVSRDGTGDEASTWYNAEWLDSYIEIADVLDSYDRYPEMDLFKNPKFKKMFYSIYQLIVNDRYIANIGDSFPNSTGVNSYLNAANFIKAFEKYKDPVFAQLAYYLSEDKIDDLQFDIFSSNVKDTAEKIKNIIDKNGPLRLSSTNLTGFGFAALRDGKARINFGDNNVKGSQTDTQRAAWMYYGSNQGHGHRDTLNLGLSAFKFDLLPDLGYPEFSDSSPNRTEWINNTISHNTVVVDGMKQAKQNIGALKHFDNDPTVKLMDAEAPDVYPQTSLYRRTTAMIRVDDQNSYVVDFFRVNGGKDHYFSFHAADGTIVTEGLKLTPQKGGSYAGKNVAYGKRPAKDSEAGFKYMGSGFQWLKNVNKAAKPSSIFSVDWKLKDSQSVYQYGVGVNTNIHLRLTMLGSINDVTLADGIPPQNKGMNVESIKYLVAHRTGSGLKSVFTSVIEPYHTQRFVKSITSVQLKTGGHLAEDTAARALKVTLANGRVDYIINSLDNKVEYLVDNKIKFKGFFGVLSESGGKTVYSYLNDGSLLSSSITVANQGLTGTITGFTTQLLSDNKITINYKAGISDLNKLTGKYIYIDSKNKNNAVYEIKKVEKAANNSAVLEVGDTSFISSFVNTMDFTKGYKYAFKKGDPFVIPLSVVKGSTGQASVNTGSAPSDQSDITNTELMSVIKKETVTDVRIDEETARLLTKLDDHKLNLDDPDLVYDINSNKNIKDLFLLDSCYNMDKFRTPELKQFLRSYSAENADTDALYQKYLQMDTKAWREIVKPDYYTEMAPNLKFNDITHGAQRHPCIYRNDMDAHILLYINSARKKLGYSELVLDNDLTAIAKYSAYYLYNFNGRKTFGSNINYSLKSFGYNTSTIAIGTLGVIKKAQVINTGFWITDYAKKYTTQYEEAIKNPNIKKVGIGTVCNQYTHTEQNAKNEMITVLTPETDSVMIFTD